MVTADRELQLKYRTKRLGWDQSFYPVDKAGNINAYGPEETISYTHFHMPSRYIITKRVFNEIKMLLPAFKPKRILDFGCGPGTAAVAASAVWEDKTIRNYNGIDMSLSMIDAAKLMTDDLPFDCSFWDKTADIVKRAESNGTRYDMAVATHTLSELTSDPAKIAATQLLFEMLDIGGLLVIIDSGNPYGSHTVRSARKFLLEAFNFDDDSSKNIDGNTISTNNSSS
jgi:ribosomal protein RSM22 (predicted rRNA methylase)